MVHRPRSKSGSRDNRPFKGDRHDALGLHNSVIASNLSSISLMAIIRRRGIEVMYFSKY